VLTQLIDVGYRPAISIGAIVGFMMSIIWGIVEFLLFNTKDSRFTDILFVVSRVTCPPWLLNDFWGDIGSPFLNGVLYGGATWMFCALRHSIDEEFDN
jgi:hypothetical protein